MRTDRAIVAVTAVASIVLSGSDTNAQQVVRPPVIDGSLADSVWLTSATQRFRVPYGWLMLTDDGFHLYVALDLVDDTGADIPRPGNRYWGRSDADYFRLLVDVNRDGEIDSRDTGFGPRRGTIDQPVRFAPPTTKDDDKQHASPAVRVAAGFGPSMNSGSSHRTWELSVPLSEIGGASGNVIGLAVAYSSREPGFTENFPTLRDMLEYSVGASRVTRLAAADSAVVVAAPPQAPIGARYAVLADGRLQITYPDGRIVRRAAGGGSIETVFPDGRVSRASPIEVNPAAPPALPSESAVTTWITKRADDLLDTIERLLGGDQVSIANYKMSEQGLGLYQLVHRRLRCIDFLVQGR